MRAGTKASAPARDDRAYWCGLHAAWKCDVTCWVRVRAQSTREISDDKAACAARKLAYSNNATNGQASNSRLGKTSPGMEAGDITKKSSNLLAIQKPNG